MVSKVNIHSWVVQDKLCNTWDGKSVSNRVLCTTAGRALDFRQILSILFPDSDTDEGDSEAEVVVVGRVEVAAKEEGAEEVVLL